MKYVLFLERQITDNKFDRVYINTFENWLHFIVAYTSLKETFTKMGLKVETQITQDNEFKHGKIIIYN